MKARYDFSAATKNPYAKRLKRSVTIRLDATAGAHVESGEISDGADVGPRVDERLRLIVSNPPYSAESERGELPAMVREWEPGLALFAEDEGVARYAAIVGGGAAVLERGGWLIDPEPVSPATVSGKASRRTAAANLASSRRSSTLRMSCIALTPATLCKTAREVPFRP